ncbi:trans-sulfuration enzyme family protein [Salinispira pacifica]|nr:aminotransferase class I/II-fold pyridoxal phosphate-dependent enzyme [Salinispira pacifica]
MQNQDKRNSGGQGFNTSAIRNRMPSADMHEHSSPIYMTSSFTFESAEEARDLFSGESQGNIYSRYSNPNTDEFINKMMVLEHCEDGVPLASGMSAMFVSILAHLNSGDHLVASRSIFGSTHQIITQILPRWGIEYSYVDIGGDEYRQNPRRAWEEALRPNTKMLFCETPSNPGLDIIDLEMLGKLCRNRGILFNVDNCFATPYFQNPRDFGADIVGHSATKFIDGQGRSLGGVLLGSSEAIEPIRFFARHSGPALSPFNAWILSKSLETLGLRMERHADNAEKIVEFLKGRREISWVKYPHDPDHPGYSTAKKQMRRGGAMVSFELKDGLKAGISFLNSLEMISLTANLGDSRSIATHPASTTHSKLSPGERATVGISDGFVRISAGLEDAEDIIQDIQQALERS